MNIKNQFGLLSVKSYQHLHNGDFCPSLPSNLLEDAGPQRPMQVSQDPQLVERCWRAPPGKREVAPHLQQQRVGTWTGLGPCVSMEFDITVGLGRESICKFSKSPENSPAVS
jgi:hypothetical protein